MDKVINVIPQDEAHIEALLSEEEVARLSGEVAWLKEETRHGDRKVGELEEQVIIVGSNRLHQQKFHSL